MREQTGTIDSQGHVEVPRHFLEKHDLHPGSKVKIEERGNELVIKPSNSHSLSEFIGILKGATTVEEIIAERRETARREDDEFRPR